MLRRDDWTCQATLPDGEKCGRKAGRFEAHHIVALAEGGTNDVSNGITYCRPCHIDIHRPTRTPEQILWDDYIATL